MAVQWAAVLVDLHSVSPGYKSRAGKTTFRVFPHFFQLNADIMPTNQ